MNLTTDRAQGIAIVRVGNTAFELSALETLATAGATPSFTAKEFMRLVTLAAERLSGKQ